MGIPVLDLMGGLWVFRFRPNGRAMGIPVLDQMGGLWVFRF